MPRTKIRANQVNEDTLQDADNDTTIEVESSSDEDKIRFSTSGSERMIIDNAGLVGIGISAPTEILTLNATEPTILFKENGTDMATIGVNSSDNILIENKAMNKHIVFKVNDQGVVKEGFRLDGAVPEVVVNQTSDSLVDFRVESDNNTHMLYVSGGSDRVGIGTDAPDYTLDVAGDIGVDQYIYHNGDADTLINFSDDKIVLKAGNKAMITMEEKNNAPHEVTINDGGNNVDFVVKGNGSNQGNPGMKFDASTNKLGINGVGTPSWELDVAGDIGLAEYIYHRTDTDTYIRFEDDIITLAAGGRSFIKIEEASTDKVVINNGLLDIDLKVGGENNANLIRTDAANDSVYFSANSGVGSDNNFFVSGSTRSRGTSVRGTAVFGGDLVVSGTLTAVQKHICTAKYTADNNTQQYIRFNAAGSNGSPSVNNKFVAPCAGNLAYAIIRSTGTPGQTAVAFHRALDGTANLSTTPQSPTV